MKPDKDQLASVTDINQYKANKDFEKMKDVLRSRPMEISPHHCLRCGAGDHPTEEC